MTIPGGGGADIADALPGRRRTTAAQASAHLISVSL
jgi:hypothetical protein